MAEKETEIKASRKDLPISDLWVKAAVVGGLWASIEIIIGSFLHNARIPMAGSMLAFSGTVLLIGFYQLWPQRGLIIRAGLITAIMKSVSPSAFILGPMTGIMLEAVLLELMILLFGNNLFGLILAGIASVSSALMHKLINLLIFYGFDLIQIYVNIVNFALKQFGLQVAEPVQILVVMFVFYAVFGIVAAILGYYIGNKSLDLRQSNTELAPIEMKNRNAELFTVQTGKRKYIPLLIMHILAVPTGLYLLKVYGNYAGFLFIGIYIFVFGFYYRTSMRRLRKPVFWMQLVIIILLSALFWETDDRTQWWFSLEGLKIGLAMVARALFIVTAFTAISVELYNDKVRNFLFNVGFGRFYQAVGMAFGALPIMISLLPTSKEILKNPMKSLLKPLIMADQWVVVFKKG